MTLESPDNAFCIVMLMDVWWGEFNGAIIAAYGSFEFTQSLIVKDVTINTYDLRVLPGMVDGLVGFDEIVDFA